MISFHFWLIALTAIGCGKHQITARGYHFTACMASSTAVSVGCISLEIDRSIRHGPCEQDDHYHDDDMIVFYVGLYILDYLVHFMLPTCPTRRGHFYYNSALSNSLSFLSLLFYDVNRCSPVWCDFPFKWVFTWFSIFPVFGLISYIFFLMIPTRTEQYFHPHYY